MKKRVLILCTGNSARSQMAEGLLRVLGGESVEVFSAGTRPSSVRSEAIAVMSEIGIDLASHRSKHVREFDGQHFDFVITVCDNANETCPIFPGKTDDYIGAFLTRQRLKARRRNVFNTFAGFGTSLLRSFVTSPADSTRHETTAPCER